MKNNKVSNEAKTPALNKGAVMPRLSVPEWEWDNRL